MWQATVGKIRYKEIYLADGILRAINPYGVLCPLAKPDLPTEFSRVYDSKAAIRFELKYSPLGHDYLLDNPDKRKGGDPLQWVCEQAKFVKIALELVYDIAHKDGNHALEVFQSLEIKKINNSPLPLLGNGKLIYPCGAYHRSTIIPVPVSAGEALRFAEVFIAMLVNGNTENMRQKLEVQHNGTLVSVLSFRALIEAIWSMVGDLALKIQQGQENGYFKKCEWCKITFLATDKRQRFCPPATGQQSLCGLKYRQHKLQLKQKGGTK